MSDGMKWIGAAKCYPVNKEASVQKVDEIEVRVSYRRNCSAGRGFYVTLTPQIVEDRGTYKGKSYDFWQVKTHKLLRADRYSKKAEAEALSVLVEFEPYWVSQMASSYGLTLEHDPIHGNW